jgi:hypothetical protein
VWGAMESGWVTKDADDVLRRWARFLEARGDSLVGDPVLTVRAAASACFAIAWMFQVAGWAPPEPSGSRVAARASHRAVAAQRRQRTAGRGWDSALAVQSAVSADVSIPRGVVDTSVGPQVSRAASMAASAVPSGADVLAEGPGLGAPSRAVSSGFRFAPEAPRAACGDEGYRNGTGPGRGSPA